jgi:hypothetical protein
MTSRLMRSFQGVQVSPTGASDDKDEAMRGGAFQNGRKDTPSFGSAGNEGRTPRWMVVFGVVAYCACAWIAVFHFGGQATDWLADAMNRDTLQAANESDVSAR